MSTANDPTAPPGGSPPPPAKKPSHKSKGVARRPRTRYSQAVYDRILAGYRAAPGNHAAAARYAAVDRAMARNTWNNGFPRQRKAGAHWARPIREVLAEEVDAARIRQAELNRRQREADDAAREQARQESIEELAEEGKLRGVLRKDLLGVAYVVADMVPAVRALAGVIKAAVLAPDGKTPLAQPAVNAMQASKLLKDWAATVSRAAYAGGTVIQLGRLVRGQTTSNAGRPEDMSPEEALAELEMAAEVFAEAKATARPAQGVGEDGPDAPVH